MTVTSITAIIVAAIVGILSSKATLDWATKNGKNIGKWVAKKIPGDKLEEWLVTFIEGIAEGLKSEIKEDSEGVSVDTNSGKLTISKTKLRG